MQAAQRKLIYLYCVTKAKPDQSNFENSGAKIYPVYFQGTYAIVSKVSPEEFSEENLKKRLTDMEWVEKRVREHEEIIEKIMRYTTVLPFKFGTVFQTEKNVAKFLKTRARDFKRLIANLEGKEEWGIKIYCDLPKFKKVLEEEDKGIKEKKEEITSAGKGKAYFLRKKRDELIKNTIDERISEYTLDSFDRLKRTSTETEINRILPKEVTEKKDKMVFNAAFLVNKKRIREFNSIVEYLKEKYGDKGLTFDCTGPWPPYNFCKVKTSGA